MIVGVTFMSLHRVRGRFQEWWSLATWETCGAPPQAMSREIKSGGHGKQCPVAFCDRVMAYREGEKFGHECPDAVTDDHRLPRSLGGVNEEWCLVAMCNECNRILGQMLNEGCFQEYGGVSKVPFRKLIEFVDFQYLVSSKSFSEKDFPELSRRFKEKKSRVSQTRLTKNEVGESQGLAGSLISEISNQAEEVIS